MSQSANFQLKKPIIRCILDDLWLVLHSTSSVAAFRLLISFTVERHKAGAMVLLTKGKSDAVSGETKMTTRDYKLKAWDSRRQMKRWQRASVGHLISQQLASAITRETKRRKTIAQRRAQWPNKREQLDHKVRDCKMTPKRLLKDVGIATESEETLVHQIMQLVSRLRHIQVVLFWIESMRAWERLACGPQTVTLNEHIICP